MAVEQQIKRPRGNPNFQKKKQETNNTAPMADKKEGEGAEKKEQTTPPAETPASTDLPADLFDDKIPSAEVLPLDGPVKEKAYAALPTDQPAGPSASGASPATPSEGGGAPPADPGATAPTASFDSTPSAPAQPVAPPLTLQEINDQASQTADLMIRGYDKLHMLGRYLGKIDEQELGRLHSKGKINLEQTFPVGKKTITAAGFFSDYNAGIEENIVVSTEFKEKIRPPLIRICVKRNWLLNDEAYVLTMLAEDMTTKVSMLIGLKKSANLVLEACHEIMKKQNTKAPEAKVSEHPEAKGPGAPSDFEQPVDWREHDEPNTQQGE